MAKNTSVDQIVSKWANNTSGAGQAFKDGVDSVTESPMEAAAKQKDLMRQRFLDALDSGKWERGLRRVDLGAWKDAMKTKGANRIATGVTAAKPKVAAFQQQWTPYIRQVSQRIKQMPKGGMANALARIQANLEAAQKFTRN